MSDRPEPRPDEANEQGREANESLSSRPHFPDSAASRWTGRLAIAALCVFIAAALAIEFQRERVRWRAAGAYRTFLAAYERDATGKVDEDRRRERILQATQELRSSVGVGAEARWKAVEASWLLEAGETDAARVLLDDLVAKYPEWLAVRVDRMTAACDAKDADAVVADCDWLSATYGEEMFAYLTDATSGVSNGVPLPNLRAYMLAVVDRNLDEAEREIDRVLETLSSGDDYGNASLLDTKGYVLYRQGKYAQATKLLDKAVKLLDDPARQPGDPLSDLDLVRTYRRIAGREASQDLPRDVASLEESRAFYERAQSIAVMLYHRALAFEARGWNEEAEADRRTIAELGFEANDSLF